MKSPTISKLTVIDHEMIVHVYKPNTVPYGKIWNCVGSIWGYMYIYDLNYRWEKIKILEIIYALLWLKQNLNNNVEPFLAFSLISEDGTFTWFNGRYKWCITLIYIHLNEQTHILYLLFVCLEFIVPLENISLTWRRHDCW